jgi:NADH dehydrogenase
MPKFSSSIAATTTSFSRSCIKLRRRFSRPSEVAAPLRQLAQQQPNLSVLLGEVTALSWIHGGDGDPPGCPRRISVRLPGCRHRSAAHLFRTRRICAVRSEPEDHHGRGADSRPHLGAYERAEQLGGRGAASTRALTFVLVGAGPTGVELAASIAQMARVTLRSNFRRIDPADTKILLVEGAARILAGFQRSVVFQGSSSSGKTRCGDTNRRHRRPC